LKENRDTEQLFIKYYYNFYVKEKTKLSDYNTIERVLKKLILNFEYGIIEEMII